MELYICIFVLKYLDQYHTFNIKTNICVIVSKLGPTVWNFLIMIVNWFTNNKEIKPTRKQCVLCVSYYY